MRRARPIAEILAFVAASAAIACGPQHLAGPIRPGETLIVLLPDSDSGQTGAASVTNRSGSLDLSAARESTVATANGPPGAARRLTESDVERMFGEALAALPPPPRRFTLYFRFESDVLTAESRALVPEVLEAVKARSVPEVAIVGHTDTMGVARANIELGRKRAMMVRDLLVNAGLAPSMIEVTSHGQADLLVHTPDHTPEPRNRRVEITVR